MASSNDFEAWYKHILKSADLIGESPVKGCDVLKGYCLEIWNQIREFLAGKLKELGYQDMYFPLLIPESIMKKQEEHYKVFESEVLTVTGTQKETFDEKFLIRPTSEMVIYASIADWIKNEADLPLLINQWCSIIRWENRKPNLPLIRTNEFLWHECHSVHASKEEAQEYAQKLHNIYRELLTDYAAIPAFEGYKPEHRMFPGAEVTLAFEVMTPNCKAVQSATSHNLGQNFSKPLNITFVNKNMQKEFAWQACAGLTTRIIGAIVMLHSDDKGLVLPPRIAPVQCVFIEDDVNVKGVRTKKDNRAIGKDEKIAEWVRKGIPAIVTGKDGKYEIYRRDTNQALHCAIDELQEKIPEILESMQENLLNKAKKFRDSHTFESSEYQEFKSLLKNRKGFVKALWCGVPDCARKIRVDTEGSLRVVVPHEQGICIGCGSKAKFSGVFGQSY